MSRIVDPQTLGRLGGVEQAVGVIHRCEDIRRTMDNEHRNVKTLDEILRTWHTGNQPLGGEAIVLRIVHIAPLGKEAIQYQCIDPSVLNRRIEQGRRSQAHTQPGHAVRRAFRL